jgi:hypothetical protein
VARVATEVGLGLAERGQRSDGSGATRRRIAYGRPRGLADGSSSDRARLSPLTTTDVLETARHANRLGSFDVLLAHGSAAAVGLSRARVSAPRPGLPRLSSARAPVKRPRLRWGRERLVAYPNEPITVVVDRMAVGRCARILVLSEYSRSLLMADHPDQRSKIRRVSGGVETKSFSPGAECGPRGRDSVSIQGGGSL